MRERRRRLGLAQDGLAHACGLTVAHVQRIELGALRRLPPAWELHRIAAALGVKLADLFGAAGHAADDVEHQLMHAQRERSRAAGNGGAR